MPFQCSEPTPWWHSRRTLPTASERWMPSKWFWSILCTKDRKHPSWTWCNWTSCRHPQLASKIQYIYRSPFHRVWSCTAGSSEEACIEFPVKIVWDRSDTNQCCQGMSGWWTALSTMINLSLATGQFPDTWKGALVKPKLKKPGLELVKPTRPVSNLPFLSKLTEKVVV